ncbi:MAG: WD40 repeat domain-containing protein [Planctomycetota bacterium]
MADKGLLTEAWYVSLGDYIIDLAWSPDASKLTAVTVEGAVFLIEDRGDSAYFKLIGEHAGGANSVSWRHDGIEFATAGHDGLVKIWDANSCEERCSLDAGNLWVSKAVYSPRRNVLATAAGRCLKLWNEQHRAFYESTDHSSTIADVAWNPRGPGIAAAANQGVTLHLSDTAPQPRRYSWPGSSLVLKWSPDARYIATGEQDATIHFLFMDNGKDAQIRGYSTKVQSLSWNSTASWLATAGGDVLVMWDCSGVGPAGREPRVYESHSNKVTQLAFQADGPLLASSDASSFLFLWDPIKHDQVIGGVLLSSPATSLRWGQGDRFAVGQEDGRVVVFDVQTVTKG